MRGILDHGEAVGGRQLEDRIHIAEVAEEMGNDDCAGTFGDARLDGLGLNVVRLGIHIGENGDRRLVEYRSDGAHIRDGRCDDFVAGFGIDSGDRRMNRCGAGRDASRVLDAVSLAKLGFELGNPSAVCAAQNPRFHDLLEVFRFFDAEVAPRDICVAW